MSSTWAHHQWPGGVLGRTQTHFRIGCPDRLAEVSNSEVVSDDFDDSPDDDRPDDGQIAEIQQAMAEARERIAEVPAETIVTNHAMGLYELAAIHLAAAPPRLIDAALGIDAFACLVEGLGDRLGENAGVMRDALHQIRLAFVQIKG